MGGAERGVRTRPVTDGMPQQYIPDGVGGGVQQLCEVVRATESDPVAIAGGGYEWGIKGERGMRGEREVGARWVSRGRAHLS